MGKVDDDLAGEEKESLLKDTITEADIGQSQLSPTIRENLLIEDDEPRASVGLWYLFLLTCCLGGLQVAWTVILSNGSPFLLSLGLSKSRTALVWIAAPLCGTVAQPIIDSLGDRNQSRFGRRRPFILGGTIGIAISVLSLAWTPEIIRASASIVGRDEKNDGSQLFAIILAIFLIYVLNMSIQFVQSGSRALIIEACPAHQQEQASAWASITSGAVIASLSMISTSLVTCLSIHEASTARRANFVNGKSHGVMEILGNLSRIYRKMPSKIRRICHIQFWAWMGRFPFLFYSTTYVAEFYSHRTTPSDPSASSINPVPLTPDALRHGTFANFLFAIVTFLASIALPFLLSLTQERSSIHAERRLALSKLSIAQAWSLSHFFWALVMFSIFSINNPISATTLVASLGLSWAVSQWAPFAIIGKELVAQEALRQNAARFEADEQEHQNALSENGDEVQAAAVMGIHNAAISAPQVVAALVCSIVFSVVQAMGWGNGTAWVMRFGGVAALGAGWLSWGSDI